MPVFYIPELKSKVNYLTPQESHHAARVLRLKKGSIIQAIDGKGNLGKGWLELADPKQSKVFIDHLITGYHQRPYHLHVAIAPTKSIDRFEWFLEKATEIGVDEITPILCKRSERKVLKLPRLQKVIITAMKQSVNAFQPHLNELTPLQEVIQNCAVDHSFIAHTSEGERTLFQQTIKPGGNCLLLIGPEGDFTKDEVAMAVEAGIQAVSLGKNRFRTETAGVVGILTVSYINN